MERRRISASKTSAWPPPCSLARCIAVPASRTKVSGAGGRILGQGDADRGRGVHLPPRWAVEHEGGGENALDPQRQGHGLAFALEGLAQHHELVGAEAGDRVGRPQDRNGCAGPARRGTRRRQLWPRLSLMCLKRSTSMNSTASNPATRLSRRTAPHRRSISSARLGSPVSGSKRALRMSWLS